MNEDVIFQVLLRFIYLVNDCIEINDKYIFNYPIFNFSGCNFVLVADRDSALINCHFNSFLVIIFSFPLSVFLHYILVFAN